GTIARWIAFIKSYDFDLLLVTSEKNRADGLSRIDVSVNVHNILNDYSPDEHHASFRYIYEFLKTGVVNEELSKMEQERLRTVALDYVLIQDYLYLKPFPPYTNPRRVISDVDKQKALISEAHDGLYGGHKGRDSMIEKL
ncbi:hypothetical protein ROZALSC1DRAFT_26336, partial [Rozella allomycis CSF55]